MKKASILFAIIISLGVFSQCAEKSNAIFTAMPPAVRLTFKSDTIGNTVISKPNCVIKIDSHSLERKGKLYYKTSMCDGDKNTVVLLLRKDANKIYVYQDAFERLGLAEQIIFDFGAKPGDCWVINSLDKQKICASASYTSDGDTVFVYTVEEPGNVTDFPRILEYHVGHKVGFIKIKFTDGAYVKNG